ncbi:2Fe-2S ferredoxin [Smittium culicis]|uniref:2Fe-2S ferredoxin n=1 Tax=Smittium culicis TaxID=133412 RepID=A0A1R1X074_9FUNG|nr:2Fe-2S ferredoxin [Smittium culicis]OMJ17459.1 2Fe-2S ferredoxin [Smittium culicis]OMJ21777.1 2Fe-2S ferredoxin [Smittium culicis]
MSILSKTNISRHLTKVCSPSIYSSLYRATTNSRNLSTVVDSPKKIKLTFYSEKDKYDFEAAVGKTLLFEAKKSNVGIAGICEGKKVCNSCHVHLDKKSYQIVGEPTEEECDIFDLASGIADVYVPGSSRLCCQITVSSELDGAQIFIPRNSLQ